MDEEVDGGCLIHSTHYTPPSFPPFPFPTLSRVPPTRYPTNTFTTHAHAHTQNTKTKTKTTKTTHQLATVETTEWLGEASIPLSTSCLPLD